MSGAADADRVVVVGAGIAGASVADHLARETDAAVTVLERRPETAAETTARSGAFVGFWGHESDACVPLLRYGIRYYGDLLSGDDGPAFVHGGRLRLATTEAGDEAIRADAGRSFDRPVIDGMATGATGGPVQYLSGDRLAETLVLPGLATEAVTGALYSPGVGHVSDPQALARSVLARATDAGATVRTGRAVSAVVTEDGRATGVRVDGDAVPADAVVVAAGPWSASLLATADVSLPVRHSRGPMVVLGAGGDGLPALFHEETGVYTRENRDGSLFVGHFPGGYDDVERLDPGAVGDGVPAARREASLDALERLRPGAAGAPVRDEWTGVRTLTPDGDPIVGSTAVTGLYAVAFNADGIQYAPAAGRLLAAELDGREPTLPAAAVAPDRF